MFFFHLNQHFRRSFLFPANNGAGGVGLFVRRNCHGGCPLRSGDSFEERPILLHMLELRYRVFYLLLSLVFTFLCATSYSTSLTHLICTPFSPGMEFNSKFIFTHVTEGLYATLQVSFMCTLLFCVPLCIYHAYSFFVPSCYQGERAIVNLIVLSIVFLFFLTLLVAFLFLLPKICAFLQQFQYQGKCFEIKLEARIGPAVHWSCTAFFLLAFLFQTPVFFFLFLRLGVIQHSFLRERRKYALFSFLLIAAFLSPPDVSGQCAFTVAGCALYELGVWCSLFHHNWLHQPSIKRRSFPHNVSLPIYGGHGVIERFFP